MHKEKNYGRRGSSRVVFREAWRQPPSVFTLVLTGVAHNLSNQSRALFWLHLPQKQVFHLPLNVSSLYLKNFPNQFNIFSSTLFHNMMSESENLSEGNVCVEVTAVPCVTSVDSGYPKQLS